MQEKFFSSNLDFLGFTTSVLCALHCAALPLILSFSALSGLTWLENFWVEFSLIGISFVIASLSLGQSYLKVHRRLNAIQIVLIGFGFILVSRFVEGAAEAWLTTIGGVMIAVAHYVNWRLLGNHKSVQEQPILVETSNEQYV